MNIPAILYHHLINDKVLLGLPILGIQRIMLVHQPLIFDDFAIIWLIFIYSYVVVINKMYTSQYILKSYSTHYRTNFSRMDISIENQCNFWFGIFFRPIKITIANQDFNLDTVKYINFAHLMCHFFPLDRPAYKFIKRTIFAYHV